MSKKEFLITVIIVVLAIALIATIIVLKKIDKANPDETTGTTSGIAHDHDGDGVPDHGDDAHEHEDNEDNTTGATDGDSTSGGNGTSGGNVDAVVPDDSDIDISVDLEDLPSDGNGTTEGGSTGTTEGGSTGTTEGDSTGTTEGGSTEGGSTEGGSSGARPGNEIDFDDLVNAGKN